MDVHDVEANHFFVGVNHVKTPCHPRGAPGKPPAVGEGRFVEGAPDAVQRHPGGLMIPLLGEDVDLMGSGQPPRDFDCVTLGAPRGDIAANEDGNLHT